MNVEVVDAFDLPEWLGTQQVSWRATSAFESGPHVTGEVRSADGKRQELDLLAVDAAFPLPVCPEQQRRVVHRAWNYGEVALLEADGRICAGVPGRQFDANLACETLRRVAKSVAAEPGQFTVSITL
ncbi:MAG: hypothetical protein H0V07_05165 [Propionibacteriales bacterium]|nr:hypothetical protein [Propionibacteriales bacterium]